MMDDDSTGPWEAMWTQRAAGWLGFALGEVWDEMPAREQNRVAKDLGSLLASAYAVGRHEGESPATPLR